MKFVTTHLPENSYLVRICDGDGPEYNRMIVVTVDGDCLFLQGWIGTPLTPSEWKSAAEKLFPDAKRVKFKRRKGKLIRSVELPLHRN